MNDRLPMCPKCGHDNPFTVEVRGVYDGGLYFECTNCHHAWPRFREGTKLHRLGQEYIDKREPA